MSQIELTLTAKQLEILEALKNAPLSFENNDDERTIKICNSLVTKGLVKREVDQDEGVLTFRIYKDELRKWGIPVNLVYVGDEVIAPAKFVKVLPPVVLKVNKGDYIVLEDGREGLITKYSSKLALTIWGIHDGNNFEAIVSLEQIKTLGIKAVDVPKKGEIKIQKGDTVKFLHDLTLFEGIIMKYSSNKEILVNVVDPSCNCVKGYIVSKQQITVKL